MLEGLPWVQEGIVEYMDDPASAGAEPLRQEAADVSELIDLLDQEPTGRELFLTFASKSWMQNGVIGHERQVVVDLMSGNSKGRESAERSLRGQSLDIVDNLPWARRGDRRYEPSNVIPLVYLGALDDDQVFKAVLDRPWVDDGLSEDEADLIRHLANAFGEPSGSFDPWYFRRVGDYELGMNLILLYLGKL